MLVPVFPECQPRLASYSSTICPTLMADAVHIQVFVLTELALECPVLRLQPLFHGLEVYAPHDWPTFNYEVSRHQFYFLHSRFGLLCALLPMTLSLSFASQLVTIRLANVIVGNF